MSIKYIVFGTFKDSKLYVSDLQYNHHQGFNHISDVNTTEQASLAHHFNDLLGAGKVAKILRDKGYSDVNIKKITFRPLPSPFDEEYDDSDEDWWDKFRS